MSSDLQSVVSSIVENNYVTLVILTAVGYDYILTLSDEIEYVWSKPWTWVSTLFVLVRYCGLCFVTTYTLVGSSFIPGPAKVIRYAIDEIRPTQGEILSVFGEWTTILFIGAADLMMILRVWAMYGGSRIILGVLLTLYALEIVPLVTTCIIVTAKLTMGTIQVLDFSFCVLETASPIWAEVRDSLEFALAAVMFLLVAAKFIRHSVEMYNMTNRWLELSRYVKLFAREGVLYFLAILLFGLVNILFLGARISMTGWQALPMGIVEYVPVFTLAPRFILSVRALYARDLQGRCGPCDMDSDFGFTSVTPRGTVIMFAGQTEVEELELDEEIPVGVRGVGSTESGV